jgi:hypothetical protein
MKKSNRPLGSLNLSFDKSLDILGLKKEKLEFRKESKGRID